MSRLGRKDFFLRRGRGGALEIGETKVLQVIFEIGPGGDLPFHFAQECLVMELGAR